MKKLIALLLAVSFMTVNTVSAFAGPRDGGRDRRRVRVERRINPVRRPIINRINRDGRRPIIRRNRPNHNLFRHDRNRRPIIRRPIYSRPGRRLSHRPRPFPHYGHRHSYRRRDSMTPMEFLGIGATIIAIAAAANNAGVSDCDCEY